MEGGGVLCDVALGLDTNTIPLFVHLLPCAIKVQNKMSAIQRVAEKVQNKLTQKKNHIEWK